MFGYVNVNRPELKVREYELYQGYYCGLCKMLKKKYGRLGQMTLSYDMTFLVLLLTALYESEETMGKAFCALHPTRKRQTVHTDFTEYGADMTILLTYFHFLDDWNDDKRVLGLCGAKWLEAYYRKLRDKYPRQCEVVEQAIQKLTEAERRKESNLFQVAGYTGEMLAELFVYTPDVWSEKLRKMGMAMGRFIYLMDAYEDLEQDLEKGRYNPLTDCSQTLDIDAFCLDILNAYMEEAAAAFEQLPVLVNAELLRNILYAGVWVWHDQIYTKRNSKKTEKNNGSL